MPLHVRTVAFQWGNMADPSGVGRKRGFVVGNIFERCQPRTPNSPFGPCPEEVALQNLKYAANVHANSIQSSFGPVANTREAATHQKKKRRAGFEPASLASRQTACSFIEIKPN